MPWRALTGRALLVAALLVGPAFAHHPEQLRVSGLAVLATAEGAFSQMRVELAEGEPSRLRAVAEDSSAQQLPIT